MQSSSSCVLIQHRLVTDTYTDRQTDRQTDTGRQLIRRRVYSPNGISIGSSFFAGLTFVRNTQTTERATCVAIGRIYTTHTIQPKILSSNLPSKRGKSTSRCVANVPGDHVTLARVVQGRPCWQSMAGDRLHGPLRGPSFGRGHNWNLSQRASIYDGGRASHGTRSADHYARALVSNANWLSISLAGGDDTRRGATREHIGPFNRERRYEAGPPSN